MGDNDAEDSAEELMDAQAGGGPPGSVLFPSPPPQCKGLSPAQLERKASWMGWVSKASCLLRTVLPYSRRNTERSLGTSVSISSSPSTPTGPGMPSPTPQCLKLDSLPEMFCSGLTIAWEGMFRP